MASETVQRKTRGFIDSSLDGVNRLMSGLPLGTMCGIFGPAEAGKTIFTTQFAFDTIRQQGGNAFIFDTEGSEHHYYGWCDAFNERFGTDVEVIGVDLVQDAKGAYSLKPESKPKGQALYVLDHRELGSILRCLGRGVTMGIKGKITLNADDAHWTENVGDSPIGQFCKAHDITYMGFDSVTAPILELGDAQANRPTRATATAYMMQRLQALSREFRLVSFGVMHETVNPADIFAKKPEPYGGKSLRHNYKFLLHLRRDAGKFTPPAWKGRQKAHPNSRELWLYRHPTRQPWAQDKYLDLSYKGLEDLEAPQ